MLHKDSEVNHKLQAENESAENYCGSNGERQEMSPFDAARNLKLTVQKAKDQRCEPAKGSSDYPSKDGADKQQEQSARKTRNGAPNRSDQEK